MKKIIIFGIVVLFFSCLKPTRDNPYDPNNPDKAYLTGIVKSPEGHIADAEVKLLTLDYEVYAETLTNAEGWYEFTRVDPGIYKLVAFAPYYLPAEYSPESLPAGSVDTVDLYFYGMEFTFDNDTVGTAEPFDFKIVSGNWKVLQDNTAPSQPNVYNCVGQWGCALYNQILNNFTISIKFKTPQDTLSEAGVVLRSQDSLNYYAVSTSRKILAFMKIKNGDPIVLQSHHFFLEPDKWYELWVEAIDNNFKIYFDGELKIEKSDDEFDSGMSGLMVNREMPPEVSISFDDVIIYR